MMNIRKRPGYMLKLMLVCIIILLLWFTIVLVADSQQEKERILASIDFWDVIIIWLMGVLGGLANSFVEREFWGIGLVCNLVLGGIAALVVYFLVSSELSPLRQIGIALVSGIGGGRIITNLKQRADMLLKDKTIESFRETIQGLLESEKGDDDEFTRTNNQTKAGNQSEC